MGGYDNFYSYGDGYDGYFSGGYNSGAYDGLIHAGNAVTVIYLIALGLAIALCIWCYAKYLGKNADTKTKSGKFFTKFFNMDKFYIDKLVRIFYMISAVVVAVGAVATPFVLWATTNFGGFFIGLLIGAVILLLGELLVRVEFELLYMFIRMARDAHDVNKNIQAIRQTIVGDEPVHNADTPDIPVIVVDADAEDAAPAAVVAAATVTDTAQAAAAQAQTAVDAAAAAVKQAEQTGTSEAIAAAKDAVAAAAEATEEATRAAEAAKDAAETAVEVAQDAAAEADAAAEGKTEA